MTFNFCRVKFIMSRKQIPWPKIEWQIKLSEFFYGSNFQGFHVHPNYIVIGKTKRGIQNTTKHNNLYERWRSIKLISEVDHISFNGYVENQTIHNSNADTNPIWYQNLLICYCWSCFRRYLIYSSMFTSRVIHTLHYIFKTAYKFLHLCWDKKVHQQIVKPVPNKPNSSTYRKNPVLNEPNLSSFKHILMSVYVFVI